MDEPRPNDAFDRELRRALAAGGGGAPGPHVDAELAAAWVDRRLDPAAARTVEAHLAGCQDCQTLFATLARIAPDEAAANEGFAWWRRLRAGWLVPATVAAAAALVIWVAVPQQRVTPTASESVQSRDNRATAPARPAAAQETPPAVAEPKATQSAVAPESDAAAGRFAPTVPEPQRKALDSTPTAPAPAAAPPAAPPPAAELERRDRLADAAAPPQTESFKETIVVTGQAPTVDTQTTSRAAVAGAAAPPPPAERQEAASAAQGQLLRQNAQLAAGLRAPAGLTIIAVDGAARWRRTGTRIEFAPRADAGFTAVTLPASADAITAGSSPGGTLCWLVGREGLVLVTTDGVRFARVTAPAATVFVAVIATDARTATVTAADGRRFRTTDGGATWQPQ